MYGEHALHGFANRDLRDKLAAVSSHGAGGPPPSAPAWLRRRPGSTNGISPSPMLSL